MSPPSSCARSAFSRRVPNPFRVGGATGGPPRSSHVRRSFPSWAAHATLTCPPGHDNAPYFVAFVASSCSASESARACFGESSMALAGDFHLSRRKRLQCARDDILQVGALPGMRRQKVMSPRHRANTAFNGLSRRRKIARGPQGLRGDRLNGRQGIFDAVVQFVEEQPLEFLGLFPLA